MTRIITGWNYGMQSGLKNIFKKSNKFEDVVIQITQSRGLLGRVYDDNKERDSEFWGDVADLYSGKAKFEIDYTSLSNVPNNMVMKDDYGVGFDNLHGIFKTVLTAEQTMAIRLVIEEYLKSVHKEQANG